MNSPQFAMPTTAVGNGDEKMSEDMDTDGTVGSRTRKKRKQFPHLFPIETSNGYSSLPDDDDSDSTQPAKKRPGRSPKNKKKLQPSTPTLTPNPPALKPPTNATNRAQKPPANSASQAQIAEQKSKKAKPITISASHDTITNFITTLSLSKKPLLQKLNGGGFSVFPVTVEDKKIIITYLVAHKLQYFTYSEPEERHELYVLKGHYKIDPEELLTRMKEQHIPAAKVKTLYESEENPSYLVQFPKGSITHAQLVRHKDIAGLKIFWERFHNNNKKPTQCHRCQTWGHSASNCGRDFRCVKCTKTHQPGMCERKDRTVGTPSCVNCNKEGHTSNSVTCEYYIRFTNKLNAQKREKLPRRFTSTPAPWAQQNINPNSLNLNQNFPPLNSQNVTFSQSTNHTRNVNANREYRPALNPNPSPRQTEPNLFEQFNELKNEFNNIPGIQDTLKKFAKIIQDLKSAKSENQRISILMTLAGLSQ